MSDYLVVYTGMPDKFFFGYDLNTYTIYADHPEGKVFLIGTTDFATKSFLIHIIHTSSLKLISRMFIPLTTILRQTLEKYIGTYIDDIRTTIYPVVPSKFISTDIIYHNTLFNLYSKFNDPSNIYSYIYYKKHTDGTLRWQNPNGIIMSSDRFDMDEITSSYTIFILENLYKYYNFIRRNMPAFRFNEEYDIKKVSQNIDNYIFVFGNKYADNSNLIFYNINSDTNKIDIFLISVFYMDIDIYDLNERKFVLFNLRLPLFTQTFLTYDLSSWRLEKIEVKFDHRLSMINGFYNTLNAVFPFRLKLSAEHERSIVHLVGIKYNIYYNNIFSTYTDLFNIYDIDYYDIDFVLKNVYHELYRKYALDYINGKITKDKLISDLKFPIILSEKEPVKASFLPVDSKSKVDFSYPSIMIFE